MLYRFICCTGLCAVPVYVLCRFMCCTGLYVLPVYVVYRFMCCTGLCAVPVYVLYRFMCCTGLCAVPVYVLYQDLLISFSVRTTVRLITACSMLISDLLTCEDTLRLLGVHYKVQRITFFSHTRTVHLDIIKVFYSPNDAQVNCLKNNIKIYIKITPTCFGSSGSALLVLAKVAVKITH